MFEDIKQRFHLNLCETLCPNMTAFGILIKRETNTFEALSKTFFQDQQTPAHAQN